MKKREPELLEAMIVAAMHNAEWEVLASHAAALLDALPDHDLAGYALALGTYRSGRFSEARAAVQRAIDIKPSVLLYTLAGDIHMASGRLDEAGRDWMSARELEPRGEAATKLHALMFYRRRGAHTRVIPRIGWRLAYLGCLARLVGAVNEKIRSELHDVGEAIGEDLETVAGNPWSYFGDPALHDAWGAAVGGSDIEALGGAADALLDATRAALADHLPQPCRPWLEVSHGLCWVQALGCGAEEDLARGGRPDLSGWHRLAVRFASQLTGDEEFLRRHPSFARLADRFVDFCAQPCSREAVKIADRLIEEFRAEIFR